jgi:hypothetical protein
LVAAANPVRGDLSIDRRPLIHQILFVFQRRGDGQIDIELELFSAAPLKNKKEVIIYASFL